MPLKQKLKKSKKVKDSLLEEFAPNFSISHLTTSDRKSWKDIIKTNKKLLILGLGILVLVLLAVFSLNTYTNLRDARQKLQAIESDPNAKSKEEAQKIVEDVSKLVILPEGEEPTVATVTDPSKLVDQPFFVNSAAGDKVLIYQEAQRAILYRPSEHKVIEIAPLNTDGTSVGGIAGDAITSPSEDSSTSKKTNSNSNPKVNSNSNDSN